MEYSERVLCGTGELEPDPNIVSEEAGKLYSELQVRMRTICYVDLSGNIIYMWSQIPVFSLCCFTHTDCYWDPWWKRGGVSGTHICVGTGGPGQLQSTAEGQGGRGWEGESWTRRAARAISCRENTEERKSRGESWYCEGVLLQVLL